MTSTAPLTPACPIGVVGTGLLARGITRELQQAGHAVVELPHAPTGQELAALACLVLADDDDDGNVESALRAREELPSLPLVVRVFDPTLEKYLTETSPEIIVLSMSGVVSPGLLEYTGNARSSPLGLRPWLAGFTGKIDRLLLAGLAFVLGLTLAGTVFFAATMRLSAVDALYFVVATITTTGYGDITPKDHGSLVKLTATAFMVLGASAFAVVFALVSEWVFARRLDIVLGRVPTRASGHVVIVGAGNMALRLAAMVAARGQRALIIEQQNDHPSLSALRSLGHHVIIADAAQEAALQLAGVERASSVLVLTERDAKNLHIALVARGLSAAATVWARIDSPHLAHHVTANGSISAGSPLLLAARAFAREATRTLSSR
ncbi:MAG: hypothetical protein JWN04_3155 [Myxococcaceae bacterium]|nr:hypothetical protein [Myxococcaceae bacterium]